MKYSSHFQLALTNAQDIVRSEILSAHFVHRYTWDDVVIIARSLKEGFLA